VKQVNGESMNENLCVIGGAKFLPPNSPAVQRVRNKLKLPNPAYRQAQALRNRGKWVTMPDAHINGCQEIPPEHPWAGGLSVPRCVDLSAYGLEMRDMRGAPDADPIKLRSSINLRDYQKDAVHAWSMAGGEGVIVAPCGAGKTVMGLAAATKVDTKALVLVHTRDLASQWLDRCRQILGVTATLYGGGKKDDSGRIVIATFQTLERMRWSERYQWAKQFGLCIVDEAHHVPATTFCAVMVTVPARYRLGLTATPNRPDGLTDLLHWHLGSAVFSIDTKMLAADGQVVAPRIEWLNTGWEPEKRGQEWPKLITQMTTDEDRNVTIVHRVLAAVDDGRQVLVLSDRVDHCIFLAEQLSEYSLKAVAFIGSVPKKKREAILEQANAREIDVICATTVADEGLDLPGLDTVMLTTPSKALNRVQQRIGRVMRPHPDKKEPMVIDLVDEPGSLRGIARKRLKLYTRLGCR
jgi:superfamily II DNA or RNA helicase